jgi:mitochondrial fission protein ELM1
LKPDPLNITAFWDNRTGHVKQTQGIIDALSSITPVQVTSIDIQKYTMFHLLQNWVKFIGNIPGKKFTDNASDDLILGTGTRTHIPMLLYRHKHGGKTVTCMTPEWPVGKWVDLCCIPAHDSPGRDPNIFITQGPPNTAVNHGNHDDQNGLIVIGGEDNKTHFWDSHQIIDQIKVILNQSDELNWVITTSPRTPDSMTPDLEKIASFHSNIQFTPFSMTEPGWIEKMYSKCRYTWVTEDSVSMVYEALTAGCRVGTISVDWKGPNKIKTGLESLVNSNAILPFDLWKNNKPWPDVIGFNEAERCAKEILRRWWPDRLP